MKLTPETLAILQNFASINPNMVLKANDTRLRTMAEAKNIIASATIVEQFDAPIGIYDLNEFLSAISLLQSPELTVAENVITFVSGARKLNYTCANPEILTTPTKDIKDPPYEVQLSVSQALVTSLKKAASALKHTTFSFVKEAGSNDVLVVVNDSKNKSCNVYSEVVAQHPQTDLEFNFDFMIANLKMIPGDYTVELSSARISRWTSVTNKDSKLTYWIAIETSSNYVS